MARQCHQRTPAARIRRRYRRYRFLGMLTALVLLGGGLYLGLTEGEWIICVVGALFLLLSAGMIATDTPPLFPPRSPPT